MPKPKPIRRNKWRIKKNEIAKDMIQFNREICGGSGRSPYLVAGTVHVTIDLAVTAKERENERKRKKGVTGQNRIGILPDRAMGK